MDQTRPQIIHQDSHLRTMTESPEVLSFTDIQLPKSNQTLDGYIIQLYIAKHN